MGTDAPGANALLFEPFIVDTTIVIDQLACEVSTQGAAGKLARLGIGNADIDWNPTTLVIDGGTVAVDSTGIKTASIADTTLTPGRYFGLFNTDGAATYRTVNGSGDLLGFWSTMGSSSFINAVWATGVTFAAFAGTHPAITNVGVAVTGVKHRVLYRVKTP
jgi:hypothetical protein